MDALGPCVSVSVCAHVHVVCVCLCVCVCVCVCACVIRSGYCLLSGVVVGWYNASVSCQIGFLTSATGVQNWCAKSHFTQVFEVSRAEPTPIPSKLYLLTFSFEGRQNGSDHATPYSFTLQGGVKGM